MHILKQIAEDETDLVGRIFDPGEQKALASDLIHYRRITRAQAQELAAESSSPRSGFRHR